MGRKAVITTLLFAGFALAGCLSGDDLDTENDNNSDGSDAIPEGTGVLEGRVMDESLDPVAGARITLVQGDNVSAEGMTQDGGHYRITGVEPGEHRMQITASCCREHVQGVQIHDQETTTVNVQLIRFTQDDIGTPYMERFEWTGFVSCSYRDHSGSGYHSGPCEDLDDNTDRVHDVALKRGLKTLVVAMDWDSELTNLQERLVLRHYVAPWQSNAPTFFRIDAEPPIEVTIGPEDARDGEDLYFANIEEQWDTQFQVWAGGTPNVVYQQPFTVWYQLYYWEEAPEGTSALHT